jgi:predicted ATPase
MESIGNDAKRLRIGVVRESKGIEMITSGIATYKSTGSRVYLPIFLAHLARAYAEVDQFDDAWHCIGETLNVVETTKERWYEAEINRISGEIALKLTRLGPPHAEIESSSCSDIRLVH